MTAQAAVVTLRLSGDPPRFYRYEGAPPEVGDLVEVDDGRTSAYRVLSRKLRIADQAPVERLPRGVPRPCFAEWFVELEEAENLPAEAPDCGYCAEGHHIYSSGFAAGRRAEKANWRERYRWQRGDREYAVLEALANDMISTQKAVELLREGGEPPLVGRGVMLPVSLA